MGLHLRRAHENILVLAKRGVFSASTICTTRSLNCANVFSSTSARRMKLSRRAKSKNSAPTQSASSRNFECQTTIGARHRRAILCCGAHSHLVGFLVVLAAVAQDRVSNLQSGFAAPRGTYVAPFD